ncbi:putative sodium-coupled neutral amino acid transporter 10 isoform X1 [Bolinopsis microptera]|uniref:putative sodium-coupled neutral amino acid transporter 10 isoform X1 n=1 Tax=Bolinopsis microptera TaxID=2820187 RepID=UPI003078D0D7
MSTNWSSVINMANSIIGVGILALPLCIKSLGYFLGTATLLICGYITINTSYLLVLAAYNLKARSYEQLSMKTFGVRGKMACELGISGMLYGVLVAFHGVIGDSSGMIAEIIGIENTANWRLTVQLLAVLTIEIPFSLLRNLSSLNMLSAVSLFIYSSFTLFVFSNGVGEWLLATESSGVQMVNMRGLLKSFPIIALAFNCQTTLLPIYNELPNPTIKRMSKVSVYAISFVGGLYLTIGVCGALAFGTKIDGNVLNNFPVSPIIVLFKCGFLLCIALSFPLVIYPSRISLNSLYLGDKGDPNHMTSNMFNGITGGLIFSSLGMSIMFPKVDTILALSGATAGCLIGFILPALIYLKASDPGDSWRGFAKFVLVMGMLTTVAGVFNIVFPQGAAPQISSDSLNPKHIINGDQQLGQRIQLDVPNPDQVEPAKAEQLGHGDIVAMLAKLQAELDETKRELRAEKALRIENEINELKEQLKAQNLAVESEQKVVAVEQQPQEVEAPKAPDPVPKEEPTPEAEEAKIAAEEQKPAQAAPVPAQPEAKVEPAKAAEPAPVEKAEPVKLEEPAKVAEPVIPAEPVVKAPEPEVKPAPEENKPEVAAQPKVQEQPVAAVPQPAPEKAVEPVKTVIDQPVVEDKPVVVEPAPVAAESAEVMQEKLEQIKKLEKEKDELLAENKKVEEKQVEEVKQEVKRDDNSKEELHEVKKEI